MTDTTTSTDLVLNRLTGEFVSLKDSDDETLARFITDIKTAGVDLKAAESVVSSELVARMDRSAKWTLHLNGFEVKAASPTAGTDEYPPDALETALWDLIEAGTITPAAAASACKRGLTITVTVGFDTDPSTIARKLEDAIDVQIAGAEVQVVKADPFRSPVVAGINAIRKVPGVAGALDAVKIVKDPGPRKATVKVK